MSKTPFLLFRVAPNVGPRDAYPTDFVSVRIPRVKSALFGQQTTHASMIGCALKF